MVFQEKFVSSLNQTEEQIVWIDYYPFVHANTD